MSELQLRFLGPGRIEDAQGRPVSVRSRKQLALLAYLAIEHQTAHSRDALMALLWHDETTGAAQNNLRVTLSRLRELGASLSAGAGLPPDLLLSDRSSVQIHPAWIERVDANRLHRLLDSTRQHAHDGRGYRGRGQCAHCQTALHAAVQLYQGTLLAGLGLDDSPDFEEWLFVERERLHVLVIEAYADLAMYAEETGDLVAAGRSAERQVQLDPLREPAYRQQMRIFAKQGERSLALASFERCRKVLRAELGLDPEAETLSLHAQLLAGEVARQPGATAEAEPLPDNADAAGAAPARHNLPQQLTSFMGREEELAAIGRRLEARDRRLISLVAPGGSGKTRLALQVGAENLHRFADGVYFVPLAGVQSAGGIPAAIMDALGLRFAAGAATPLQQLMAVLARQQILLIVDNFEHLIEDGVDLLLNLLRAAPNLTLLVTTREQLNCQAEDLFVLRGLATPSPEDLARDMARVGQYAAVRLFCERAYRLNKEFQLTPDTAPCVAEICRLVDGLPLAIELATFWLRDFDCAGLLAAIIQGQEVLATTEHDVPLRQRSMQAVFLNSWQLLTPAEQHTLNRLAVCPGAFSVRAARKMTGAALADLTRLRHKSLLRNVGSGYYEFHPLIRHFAAATLEPEAHASAEACLAEVYLAHVAEQGEAFRGAAPQAALEAIQRELDNIHAAWQWAQAHARDDLLLRSITGLAEYYTATGRSAEGEARFLSALAALPADPGRTESATRTALHLRLLDEACRCQIWQAKLPKALAVAQLLVAAAQAAADTEFEVRGLNHWGNTLHQQGKSTVARKILEDALALAYRAGPQGLAGEVLLTLGVVYAESGERSRAEASFQEALELQRSQCNRLAEQRIVIYLGRLRIEDGDYQAGQRFLEDAMHLLQLTGSRPAEARIVNSLGYVDAMLGNYTAALEHHAASRRISREIQQPIQESHALHNLCTVERKLGNLAQAEAYGQEALRLALANELPDAAHYARLHLGYVWLAAGELDEAAAAFQLAGDGWGAQQRTNLAMEATVGLAAVFLQRGSLAGAGTLIEPIVPLLMVRAPEGTDEPFEMYLTCYRILAARGDQRAGALLAAANAQLEELAGKITDRQIRHSFWHAAPAHRQLRELWQAASAAVGAQQNETGPRGPVSSGN